MDIERQEDKPDPMLFMEIGYDPIRPPRDENANVSKVSSKSSSKSKCSTSITDTSRVRHYRKYYTKELEKEEEVMGKSPFMVEQIYRMKQVNSGYMGIGGSNDPKDCKPVEVGQFKGLI